LSKLALPIYRPVYLPRDQERFGVKFIGVYDDREYTLGTIYSKRYLRKHSNRKTGRATMKLWTLIKWGIIIGVIALVLYIVFVIALGALIILLPFT